MNRTIAVSWLLIFAVLGVLSVGGCRSSSTVTERVADHAATDTAHWTYRGDTGPTHWSALDPQYSACADRSAGTQSPIDFSSGFASETSDVAYNYRASGGAVVNNGHTIMFTPTDGGSITVAGKTYTLSQFHFHAPSEHTVDALNYPMEGHLVHQAEDGTSAVVGVFYRPGAPNRVVASLWAQVSGAIDHETDVATQINAADLLPSATTYYRYAGSLTTPPCDEGLVWTVLDTPATVSAADIWTLLTLFGGNNRPAQSLNGRTITHVE